MVKGLDDKTWRNRWGPWVCVVQSRGAEGSPYDRCSFSQWAEEWCWALLTVTESEGMARSFRRGAGWVLEQTFHQRAAGHGTGCTEQRSQPQAAGVQVAFGQRSQKYDFLGGSVQCQRLDFTTLVDLPDQGTLWITSTIWGKQKLKKKKNAERNTLSLL